jgi:TRAP-type C4-dicarboxylate transport system substrate-binding protein
MQTEIDDRLLEELRKLASEQGRPERELLDEAVMSYLERSDPRRFEELLERMSSRFELSEEEAEKTAYEELHAMRRERRAAP